MLRGKTMAANLREVVETVRHLSPAEQREVLPRIEPTCPNDFGISGDLALELGIGHPIRIGPGSDHGDAPAVPGKIADVLQRSENTTAACLRGKMKCNEENVAQG